MQENTRRVTSKVELGDDAPAMSAAVCPLCRAAGCRVASVPAHHACRVAWAGSHQNFRTQLQAPTRYWAAFWVAEAAGPPLPRLRIWLLQQLRLSKSRQASLSLGRTQVALFISLCYPAPGQQ